jgi:transcriptional regulator with XRE-family HTH domain
MAQRIDVVRLGRLVRRKRQKKHLSLRELAEKVELKIPTLSRIERGASKEIGSATLLALTNWLGANLEELRAQLPKRVIRHGKKIDETPDILDVYLRADKNLSPKTAEALSALFRTAYENMVKTERPE